MHRFPICDHQLVICNLNAVEKLFPVNLMTVLRRLDFELTKAKMFWIFFSTSIAKQLLDLTCVATNPNDSRPTSSAAWNMPIFSRIQAMVSSSQSSSDLNLWRWEAIACSARLMVECRAEKAASLWSKPSCKTFSCHAVRTERSSDLFFTTYVGQKLFVCTGQCIDIPSRHGRE
jgi:hypothetical protein